MEVNDVEMGSIELELKIGVEVDDVQMGGVELEWEIIDSMEVDDIQISGIKPDNIELVVILKTLNYYSKGLSH